MKPGDVFEDVLTVERKMKRSDAQKVVIDLYAVDASMTSNGFVGMSSENDEQQNFGLWTVYETSTADIEGDAIVDVPFVISVPKNATPGQHVGGLIVVEMKDKTVSMDVNSGSVVRLRYATTILVNVDGEIAPSYEINNVTYKIENGSLVLDFDFHNTGNVMYNVEGDLVLNGLYDQDSLALPSKSVLPGQSTHFHETYPTMSRFLTLTDVDLDLNISYDFMQETFEEVHQDGKKVWYVPLKLLIVLGVFFLLFYFIIYKLTKRMAPKR